MKRRGRLVLCVLLTVIGWFGIRAQALTTMITPQRVTGKQSATNIRSTVIRIPKADYTVWFDGDGDADDWDDVDEYDLDEFDGYDVDPGEKLVSIWMGQTGTLCLHHSGDKSVSVYADAGCKNNVASVPKGGIAQIPVSGSHRYYIRFLNASRNEKKITLQAYYYDAAEKTMKENQWCSGANSKSKTAYYRFTVDRTGILKLSGPGLGSPKNPKIQLYDGQKNKLKQYSARLSRASFPIAPGTYYLSVDNGTNAAELKWKLKAADQGNTSRSSAVLLRRDKSRAMLFSGSPGAARWYRIVIKQPKYIAVQVDGKARVSLENQTGKRISCSVSDSKDLYSFKQKLRAGTYYLCVTNTSSRQGMSAVQVKWDKRGAYWSPKDFDVDEFMLRKYTGKGGAVTIPPEVTAIAMSAFQDCTSVTSVTIPKTVTWYGTFIFSGCTGLKKAVLPENMGVIPAGMFARCSSLKTVVIPGNKIERVRSWSFEHCTSLKRMVIPEGVTDIESEAFLGCTALEEVVFPDSLEYIGREAFAGCTALKKADIPDSVYVADDAFEDCDLLE